MGKSDPRQDSTDFNLLEIFEKTADRAGHLVLSMAAGGIIVESLDRRKTTHQKLKSIKPYIEKMGCLGIDNQIPEFVYNILMRKISEAPEQIKGVERLDKVEKDATGVLACVYITRVIKEACSYGSSVNERLKAMRKYIDSVGNLFSKGLESDDLLIDGIFDAVGADRELASALYKGVDIKKIIKQRFMETKGASIEKSGRGSKAGATPKPVKGKAKPKTVRFFINQKYGTKAKPGVRRLVKNNQQELLKLGLIEPGRRKNSYSVVNEAGLEEKINDYRSAQKKFKSFRQLSQFLSLKFKDRGDYRKAMNKLRPHLQELEADGLLVPGVGGRGGYRIYDENGDKLLERMKGYGIKVKDSKRKSQALGSAKKQAKQRSISVFVGCSYDTRLRPEIKKIISDNSQELLDLGLIEPGKQKNSYRAVDEAGLKEKIKIYRSGGID